MTTGRMVMATRAVPIPADVGQTVGVEIACGAQDGEPLMEASASEDQDAEAFAAATVPAD